MKSNWNAASSNQISLATREILRREQARLPNLRAVTIVLPNLKAAQDTAASFALLSGYKTLVLPRFTTLAEWAEWVDLGASVVPREQRQVLLYEALRAKNWFESYDLWEVTDELLGLVDELNEWQVDFPHDDGAFVDAIQRATLKKLPAALRFEARLVHELWSVLNKTASMELSPAMAYVLRLQRLAANMAQPVYGIGLRDLSPAEETFFRTLEQAGLASRFSLNPNEEHIFHAAWPPSESFPNITVRAQSYAHTFPENKLTGYLSLYGAYSLESEARGIELKVREWLAEGKSRIGLIAQDRLVARRVRALLERVEVLVEDETGWTFSTTSASALVVRLIDTLEHNFAYADFLDLVKSPFLFASRAASEKRAAVAELEKLLRKYDVSAGFQNFFQIAKEHGSTLTVNFLQEFWQRSRAFNLQSKTLSLWLTTLLNTLQHLDALDALRADEAGRQLVETLIRLQQNLQNDLAILSAAEWRAWLNRQMESSTFRDTSIKSPIVFTHLALTRAREFDAVVIMGADSQHLPGKIEAEVIFDEGIRLELGLPTSQQRRLVLKQDLIDLLSRTPRSLITWQRSKDDEPNLISPYFEQLSVFHELAFGETLHDAELEIRLAQYSDIKIQPNLATQPPQAVFESLLPQTISAAGYNTLMQCPYQFYARFGLGLVELDEIQRDIEKKDYGNYVHEILLRFHMNFPLVTGRPQEEMEAALTRISEEVFAPAVAFNFNARAWALRWLAVIPEYMAWQYAREAAGWRWQGGEIEKEIELSGNDGKRITLRGRIDRVDKRGEREFAVLDYKTQADSKLQKLLKTPLEDMPLLVYALLWGEPVSEAGFICLSDGTQLLQYGDDLQAHALLGKQRLGELFDAMHSGAGLPAHGLDSVCGYCLMEGLCRKGYWRG